MNRSDSKLPFLQSVATAFLAGVAGGLVFLAIGLVRHGSEVLLTAPATSFAIWVLLRSIALYCLLFAAAGVLIGMVVHLISRLLRRRGRLTFAIVVGILVAGSMFAYLSAWWQLEVLAGLPFEDPERVSGALRHGLASLGVGALLVALGWVRSRFERRVAAPSVTIRRALVALAVCLLLFGTTTLAFRSGSAAVDQAERPGQVVVVGLDALTFRVMAPMLRAGELPVFRRLIEEGAWGSYLTYGQASSPMVWTSMATGKRVQDHGISDFVTNKRGAYGAEPMKSYDRQSRALWNILGDFGQRVGLVDWLITYPPEEVNGYVVSRLHVDEENRTYPPELNAEIDSLLAQVEDYGDDDRTRNFSQIDHVFDAGHMLLDKEHLDFLALFEGVSDWVEHRYWKYYEPDLFDSELWEYEASDVERVGTMIPETYAHLDRRLGELMQRLDDDALVIVVSDHGQLAVKGRQVWMRFNRILEELGYVDLVPEEEGDGVRVDYQTSRAYAAVETPWAPLIGVNVNLAGREPEGIVDAADSEAIIQELVGALRDVRFESGKAVFGAVYATRGTRDATFRAAQADIVVTHSRYTRSDRYTQETILVGGQEYKLNDFMGADTKISGGHDHQGVIFLHGKGVRPGPIGQLVVSTALQDMIWHLTDKIDLVDRSLPLLGRLGLIERATTLDLTPTVLHAFGLPVAEDMAGRALTELLELGRPLDMVATYETGEGGTLRSVEGQSDEDMMKRLKALGYIN